MKDSSQGAAVAVSVPMVLRSDAVHNRFVPTVPEKITQQAWVHLKTPLDALQIIEADRWPRCFPAAVSGRGTGSKLFTPGSQMTRFYLLGLSVGGKKITKKRKCGLSMSLDSFGHSFPGHGKCIIQQMHSAKSKTVPETKWIKTKRASAREANVIAAPTSGGNMESWSLRGSSRMKKQRLLRL